MRSFAANFRFSLLILAGCTLVIIIAGCWRRAPTPSGDMWTSGWIPVLAIQDGDPPDFKFVRWQQRLNLVILDDFFGSGESSGNFNYYAGFRSDHRGARY